VDGVRVGNRLKYRIHEAERFHYQKVRYPYAEVDTTCVVESVYESILVKVKTAAVPYDIVLEGLWPCGYQDLHCRHCLAHSCADVGGVASPDPFLGANRTRLWRIWVCDTR